jgi:hypothetical protein
VALKTIRRRMGTKEKHNDDKTSLNRSLRRHGLKRWRVRRPLRHRR